MKDIAAKYGIPTARYARFTDPSKAKTFAHQFTPPIVIKADGLAAARVWSSARASPKPRPRSTRCCKGRSRKASAEIVVEEFLDGEELSFFALVDGAHALPLVSAQDHKRVGDGRYRPQYRWHGRLLPPPGCDQGGRSGDHGAHHSPDGGRYGGRGPAVQGRALRPASW